MSQSPHSSSDVADGTRSGRKKRRAGVGGCLLGCGGFVVASVSVLVIAGLVWSLGAKRRVIARLDAIRASGEPVTLEELETRYVESVDEESNAANLWLEACVQFEGDEYTAQSMPLPVVGGAVEEVPTPGTEWDRLEEAKAFLQNYEEAMALLHEAGERGGYATFPRDFSRGFAMEMPFLPRVRAGARMLDLEAHVHAHRGNTEGVMQSLKAMSAATKALEYETSLVGQLMKLALQRLLVARTLELLPYVDFNDSQLAELQAMFRDVNLKDSLKEALVGERVMGITAFKEYGVGPRDEDLGVYLDSVTQVIDGLEQPWPVAIQNADRVAADLNAKISSSLGKMRYMTTALLYPATSSATKAMATGQAGLVVAETLLAAQRYQLAHGQYPNQVEELVPEFLPRVPLDPLDGKPLRYKLSNGWPVVWSLGSDLVDDGGVGDLQGRPDFVARLIPIESDKTKDE